MNNFKERLTGMLKDATRKHRERVWEQGSEALEQVVEQTSECIVHWTSGKLSLVLKDCDDLDHYKDRTVYLHDNTKETVIGMVDRYLVPLDGSFPLLLNVVGSDNQGKHLPIGDREGLEHRMLSLLADTRSAFVAALEKHSRDA